MDFRREPAERQMAVEATLFPREPDANEPVIELLLQLRQRFDGSGEPGPEDPWMPNTRKNTEARDRQAKSAKPGGGGLQGFGNARHLARRDVAQELQREMHALRPHPAGPYSAASDLRLNGLQGLQKVSRDLHGHKSAQRSGYGGFRAHALGSVNWGSPRINRPSRIQDFKIAAISRALTMLDSGTVGTCFPWKVIAPLLSSA